jgi:hypothetical protein
VSGTERFWSWPNLRGGYVAGCASTVAGSSHAFASIFLSSHGVEHLLVERHDSTSNLPKAHYLNQRTMEIFRQHAVADR